MMIVKILLGVLYLSGGLVLSKCRQYHFVNESFTWCEAQSYCRKNYVGLACIENSEEMNQLINTVSSAGYNSEVWIGVYIHLDWYHGSHISDDVWNWENQTGNEPFLVSYFCQSVSESGLRLHYNNCFMEHPFICYNGGYNRSEYVLVNERMDWFRALRYCRKKFTDIANYWCPDTELKLELNGDQIWTGFIGFPHIYFSDRTNSSFSYWDNFENIFGISDALYGAADLQRSGKWRLLPSNTKLPFVCYDNLTAPGKEIGHKKVIKMNLKQEDSSMDLNDEAVKANLLKKLQESLKQKGLNGVTLKWREQPDGVVIHKEKKKTQKKEKKRTEL